MIHKFPKFAFLLSLIIDIQTRQIEVTFSKHKVSHLDRTQDEMKAINKSEGTVSSNQNENKMKNLLGS